MKPLTNNCKKCLGCNSLSSETEYINKCKNEKEIKTEQIKIKG